MKKRTMYNSKEEFERLNPYVIAEAPSYNGEKCGHASIAESFTSKKVAENNCRGGLIMTRKQAEKFIEKWNNEYDSK